MDELEKTMPEDLWRKAFEEAAETPPPRVWDAIEHRLNESDGTRIVPLWGTGLVTSRPVVWSMGVAASVALVLAGWWLLHSSPLKSSATVAHGSASIAGHHSVSMKTSSTQPHSPADQVAATIEPTNQATPTARDEQRLSTRTISTHLGSSSAKTGPAFMLKTQIERRRVTANSTRQPVFMLAETTPISLTNQHVAVAYSSKNDFLTTTTLSSQASTHALFEPLASRSMRLSRLGEIYRMVWFQPSESSVAPEAIKAKRKSHDVWASASVMSGTYDPMVSIRTASAVTSNYVALDAIRNNQSNNNVQKLVSSRPNFSVAYQASAGVQLNDHWSVESGVGYLAGRSTIETPAQLPVATLVAPAARAGSANTLYTDLVRNSASADQTSSNVTPLFNTNAYLANQVVYSGQTRQALTNDYQFVQVPVQVGYQLRPRKRLSLALLGGFITNIFVRNTVGDEIVVTAKDGIYRPVSFAATMGARFRYRPSRQWSASLAGVYQPSLGLGTSSESQVQTHPTAAGMSFGVDYHF